MSSDRATAASRRTSLGALLAIAVALVIAPSARAQPSDPPIENLSPTASSLPVDHGGLEVTFTCPPYATGSGIGGAADYGVRFNRGGNVGSDGRLAPAGTFLDFFGEVAAVPIPGTPNCSARLALPWAPDPPALYLGGLTWQAFRSCPGCEKRWEVGPTRTIFLYPNVEDVRFSIPKTVYGGYLSRFGFSTSSDLRGAEVALQWFGRRGWTDLERVAAPVPGAETVFFAKLPAGTRLVRIEVAGPFWPQGLPLERITVRKPGRDRATGPADDGEYRAGDGRGGVEFEVARGGRRLFGFEATMPFSCGGAAPQPNVVTSATLQNAFIAPDGAVVGRSRNPEGPTISILEGRLGHGRFAGTARVAYGDCAGSRAFVAHLRR